MQAEYEAEILRPLEKLITGVSFAALSDEFQGWESLSWGS